MTDVDCSIHGSRFGLSRYNGLVLQDPHKPGAQGVQVASPLHVGTAIAKNVLFDDFLTPVLSTANWITKKGSDGAAAYPVIAAAQGGTVAAVTSGAGTSSMAVSGSQLSGDLNWKAANGNLVFEAKVKLSSLTSVSAFIGFTDQTSALEMPINSAGSGNTVTTNCTDGCGFLFDSANTAQTFFLVGVANDVDATVQVLSNAPVAATYNTLRIELDTAGAALFYIDGVLVGTKMTGAVTAATALAPVLAIFERTTAAKTLTADYVYVAQDRA